MNKENNESDEYSVLLSYNEKITSVRILEQELFHETLNKETKLLNSQFDTIRFGDITTQEELIVFHYSDRSCSDCLGKQLTLLQEFNNPKNNSTITIIGAVDSFRSLSNLIRQFNLSFEVFQLLDYKSIFKEHIFMEIPFYFSCNSNFKVTNSFFPLVEDDKTTKIFLSSLFKPH